MLTISDPIKSPPSETYIFVALSHKCSTSQHQYEIHPPSNFHLRFTGSHSECSIFTTRRDATRRDVACVAIIIILLLYYLLNISFGSASEHPRDTFPNNITLHIYVQLGTNLPFVYFYFIPRKLWYG